MKKALFFGQVEHDGTTARLVIPDKDQVAQVAWEKLGGILKESGGRLSGTLLVKVTIVEDDKGKDSALERYYWGVLLVDITEAMNELGNTDELGRPWTKDYAHERLKEMFAPKYQGTHTTKRMTKREHKDYVERCERFAVQFLAITLREKTRPGSFPDEPPPGH